MHLTARALAGALLAFLLTAAAPAPPHSPYALRKLPNGLTVVAVEDHSASVVQTALWYRFGALDETPGKTGLAHALEHMMFRGTPALSAAGLSDMTALLGAEENANTANDYTRFYFVIPADKLDLALQIEADRMQHLSLAQSDWDLERGAVLSEYDGDLSQPLTKLYHAVCDAASAQPLCGLGALGKRDDVAHATAADLRRYYEEWYGPNDATLVVTGDVDPAAVFARAERYFGAIPEKRLPKHPVAVPVRASAAALTVHGDYPYTVVDVAYPAPGNSDALSGPAQILDSVIDNQRSPFYHALVESGIALSYTTALEQNLHTGLEHVFLTVAPGHGADEARGVFLRTLAGMRTHGVPADLVAAAKKQVAANAVYARDAITGLGDRAGYALGIEGREPERDDAAVTQASAADVGAAAAKFLREPAVVGVLVPEAPKPGASESAVGGVSDNFAGRVPNGPLVEAPWVKAALAVPVRLASKTHPKAFTLGNGLRLYVQEDHTNPTVFISGSIEQSPRFDPPGKTGTGSLVAELLGYGSRNYDFAAQRRAGDELAATFSFGTVFGAHGMASDLTKLLDVLADGEQHPSFTPSYVELVRTQTLSAIATRDRNPDYLAERAFDQLLYAPGDPVLREPTEQSVKAITIADLRAYSDGYFRPDLAAISVVGDVDPATVFAQVQATFGAWGKAGPRPRTALPPIPPPKPRVKFVPAAREEAQVRLGEPGLARGNPDFYALMLANEILGGGGAFDTRLMSEIRQKRGLVYDVSSALEAGRFRGTIEFRLSASPRNAGPAVALLRRQIRELRTDPPAGAELERARTKLVAGGLVAEESTEIVAARVANIGRFELPTNYYETVGERYGAITPADILRVARKYLHPDRLVEVYVGPRP
jgi:zinc protease